MDLVSVIIPVYNVEKYLDRCVESVLAQTYTDMQIILVDDGATDSSGIMCDEWAKKDQRIHVVHKKNGGLSSARNAGLDVAIGKYIYFLDSDDYISPELLELAISKMTDDIGMVSFGFYLSYDNGKIDSYPMGYNAFESKNDLDSVTMIQKILFKEYRWEAWNRIYRRDIIEKYHLRFEDNKIIFAEDMYFCLCYCAHIKKILKIPDRLYYYLIRSDSIMGNNREANNIDRFWKLADAVQRHYEQFPECRTLLNAFPIFRAKILMHAIEVYPSFYDHSENERKRIFQQATNGAGKGFYSALITALREYQIYRCEDFNLFWIRVNEFRYYFGGSWLWMRVKGKIYKFFPTHFKAFSPWNRKICDEYKQFAGNKKKIYYLASEEFGNLGDHCINERILMFLKEKCPEYAVKEVTLLEFRKEAAFLKRYIKSDDIIIFEGGGNLGNQYYDVEKTRQNIIAMFPKNKKIVFPQSIYFAPDLSKELLEGAIKSYTAKNNVTLFARDKYSYKIAKENFDCTVGSVPDIVLYSGYSSAEKRSEQIIWCMRDDAEASVSKSDSKSLERILKETGVPIKKMDLQLPYYLKKVFRAEEVEKRLKAFSKSKLVITDRLHGMIFAAITGTPCIVFSNYNHKIKGAYEWISYLPYIRYVSSVEEAEKAIPELLSMEICEYDNSEIIQYYDKIRDAIVN